MTRGQSKKIREDFGYEYTPDSKVYNIFEVHKMIDKIYDDFESMTCKNCKVEKCKIYYALVGVCTNQELINFGCNKFEKKD